MDIDAGADITKKPAVAAVARNAGVVDPMICAVVPAKPVLHAKLFPSVKVADVGFQATVNIVSMNAFGPAVSQLLRHAASRVGEPWFVEPDAAFVLTGNPYHDRSGIH